MNHLKNDGSNYDEFYNSLDGEMQALYREFENKSLNGFTYTELDRFLMRFNKLGYTFDYGLDAQPYNIMKDITQDEDFNSWLTSDNVVKVAKDTYIEQTTQYKKQFTLKELQYFYLTEF